MQDGGLSILSIIHLSIMSTIYLSMYLSIYFAIMSTIIYHSSPNQAREMQAGERRETPWAAAIETSCTAASIAWRDGRGAVRNADESLPPEHQVTEPDRQGTTTEEEKQGKLRQEYPGPSNKGADTRLRSHAITPLRDSIQLRRTRHSNSCGRTRPIRNYSPASRAILQGDSPTEEKQSELRHGTPWATLTIMFISSIICTTRRRSASIATAIAIRVGVFIAFPTRLFILTTTHCMILNHEEQDDALTQGATLTQDVDSPLLGCARGDHLQADPCICSHRSSS